jgi:exosortase/archaeosortase family protein
MKNYFKSIKNKINQELRHFPKPVRVFILKVVLFSLLWKCLYVFVLYEPRILDEPLTDYVGQNSAWVLNKLYHSDTFNAELLVTKSQFEGQTVIGKASHIYFNKRLVMFIADPCNGLELFVLYLIFIFALPATFKRKLFFVVAGLFIIHFVNILRCVGLVALLIHYDEYFNIAHHYIFKMAVYLSIFLCWFWFAKGVQFKMVTNEKK